MTSKLILVSEEFEHMEDKSVYCHNYYRHKKGQYVILEEAHDEYPDVHFYLIEFDKEILLGASYQSFNDPEINIDFRIEYT